MKLYEAEPDWQKLICFDYKTNWLDTGLFQDVLYNSQLVRNELAELAKMDWSPVGHQKLKRAIVRAFATEYVPRFTTWLAEQYALYPLCRKDFYADPVEARAHLVAQAQIAADWCMHEYSHYPSDWGVAYVANIESYIPDDLWAPDITRNAQRIARKMAAGEEVDLYRVKKNEYNYDSYSKKEVVPTIKTVPIEELQPTTGKKRVLGGQKTSKSQEDIAAEQAKQEQSLAEMKRDEEDAAYLAKMDADIAKRQKLIERWATDETIDMLPAETDQPSEDIVMQLPLTASEIAAKYNVERNIDDREQQQYTRRQEPTREIKVYQKRILHRSVLTGTD